MKKVIATLSVMFTILMFGATALAASPEETNQQIHLPTFYLDDIFQTELTWDDPLAYRMSEQQEAVQEKYSYKLCDHAKALLKHGAKIKSNISQDESSGNHQVNITVYLEEAKQFMPIHGTLPRACEMNVEDDLFDYNVKATPYSIELRMELPF